MKTRGRLLLMLSVLWWVREAFAQLETIPDGAAVGIFCGPDREVPVTFHNPVNFSIERNIRIRLYQATTATAVLLMDKPWKKLRVLPGQTVLESTRLDFPVVRTESSFVVQWADETGRVIGRESLRVFATNLLQELVPLAGGCPIGIFDPANRLKPEFLNAKVAFQDLENSRVENFPGALAVIDAGDDYTLAREVHTLAKKGKAIVWIRPPNLVSDKLRPSFCTLMDEKGALVLAQADLVTGLAENPQSQLHLIDLCRRAVHPEPPRWPDESNKLTQQ